MMIPDLSFEKSRELKKQGFPQPDYADGQIWFTRIGVPYLVYWTVNRKRLGVQSLNTGLLYPITGITFIEAIYCPTIEEAAKFINSKK